MDNIPFGEWLKRQRKARGWTQKELSLLIHCSVSTLRKLEAEERHPSVQVIERLAEVFNVPKAERTSFLRYARGEWGDIPKISTESSPWDIPTVVKQTNLPESLTSFIGRQKELDEITDLLASRRLVTLAGIGGIGKTRLAIEVGKRLLGNYPDGVWLFSLDSLSDPAYVPQVVASVFGIHEGSSNKPLLQRLTLALRTKTTLLILDNCEHVVDACVQMITTLLQNCSNLKVVATSRETLNMEGEAVYFLPPLSFPQQHNGLKELADYESVKLFMERARMSRTSFRLTEKNSSVIVDICRLVDGIALAIELAAARVDILQVEEILRQLNHSFALLASTSRTSSPRHQTLQASIDWSWKLLTEGERIFLRRLSVFHGGWIIGSAQAICEDDALNLIISLAKKSMITVEQESGRETSYHLHEVVRQYAHAKLLEAGEEEMIRTRHLSYFLHFSEQAESALRGPTQIEWYRNVKDEYDNIRAALHWADRTDLEAGLNLSSRLHQPWESVDFREGNYWLSKFLQRPESHAYPRARAKALLAHLWIMNSLDENDAARAAAQECLELFRAIGDRQGEIDGLLWLGWELLNTKEGVEHIRLALELAQAFGDVQRQADALTNLGWLDQSNRFDHWEKAIALTRQSGDWLRLANRLSVMAHFLIADGDIDSARKCLDEASVLYQRLGPRQAGTKLFAPYAEIAWIQGDYEKARALMEELVRINFELGSRLDYLWCYVRLGYIALDEGSFTEARDIFAKTVQDFQKDNNSIGVIFALEGMAGLFLAIEKPDYAASLIGWADATREKIGDNRPRLEQAYVDKTIAACIAALGETRFSAAYERGQKMTMEEVVAYALA